MRFPDVERGVMEVIEGLGFDTAIHLEKDLGGKPLVVQVMVQPSSPGPLPFLRTEAIAVTAIADGRDASRDAASAIREALTAGPHGTSFGLLDRVVCQVSPYELVAENDTFTYFRATYLVDVRTIP